MWVDSNHDGVSQAAELRGLAHSEVAALRFDYHATNRRDADGNAFRYASTLHLDRGQRPFYDVFFRSAD